MIVLDKVSKVFITEKVMTSALSNVSLEVKDNDYVVITGPSGCGKSTLLSILGLLDVPTKGSYNLAGHEISNLKDSDLAHIRNKHIGFIFQSFHLIGDMSIYENVRLPLRYRRDIDRSRIAEMVTNALERVGMQHRQNHYPSELSGGQQQRVAIARAIAGNPDLLLADEPTGNLDSTNTKQILEIIDVLHESGSTICLITHETSYSKRATRFVELSDGSIISNENVS